MLQPPHQSEHSQDDLSFAVSVCPCVLPSLVAPSQGSRTPFMQGCGTPPHPSFAKYRKMLVCHSQKVECLAVHLSFQQLVT